MNNPTKRPSVISRIRSWFSDRGGVLHTAEAGATHVSNIVAQQPLGGVHDTAAADVALRNRAEVAAYNKTLRLTDRAKRLLRENRKIEEKRASQERVVRNYLDSTEARSRMAEVHKRQLVGSKLGALAAWASLGLTYVLTGIMLCNDPVMIFNAMMTASGKSITNFDIERLPIYIISITAGFGSALVAILSIKIASSALASFLPGRREVARLGLDETDRELPVMNRVLKLIPAIIGLGVLTFLVHSLAGQQFEGDDAEFVCTMWVTLLPMILTLTETVARDPKFVHIRNTHKWGKSLAKRRARDLRDAAALLSRNADIREDIDRCHDDLIDTLASVNRSALQEVVNSALNGLTDVSAIAEKLHADQHDDGSRASRQIDALRNDYVPGLRLESARVRDMLRSIEALEQLPAPTKPTAVAQMWDGAWQEARMSSERDMESVPERGTGHDAETRS